MEPSSADITHVNDVCAPTTHMTNASQTEIRVEYLKHKWTVKNFSHCYQEYLENFVHLQRNNDETLTWSIKIYPKGNGENNKDFVFLCLNRVNGGNKNKAGFRSRFFLKNCDGKDIEMRVHPNPSHSDYVSYIKRDVLFPQIHPSDSITVYVEIDVAVETITTYTEDQTAAKQACECERPLGEDYLKLLNDDLHTDFLIRVDGRDIPVHKAVLSARSPVFSAMLQHRDTNEARTGVLCIEDVDYGVMKEMLHFIYSGICTSDMNDMASDLLIAADKYRLDDLKSHCEKILIQILSQENCCQLLIISDMYHADNLRRKAVQFVHKFPIETTKTVGWEAVLKDHSHLVTEIVRSFDRSSDAESCTALSGLLSPQ
ncbi:unnamed protein product [Bursaphelenchus okinawaensis]|uniref:BTB domain-containing protein n=1 Tax=Bursaphelenchus okinawaensis TaxID=465554 RepID=A0A811JT36_9BILA|nr:unnamed protein product [Bursaphelenchus okinawaensis]CAG9082488.1 unnamed protein product [Bursaphelenchus okinawaensis]